jgi:hypothetical protein
MGGEEAWGSSSIPYPLPIDPKFGETGTRSRNPRFDQGLPRCSIEENDIGRDLLQRGNDYNRISFLFYCGEKGC